MPASSTGKATATPRILDRRTRYQLVGYALLDRDDRFGIRSVGVEAPR